MRPRICGVSLQTTEATLAAVVFTRVDHAVQLGESAKRNDAALKPGIIERAGQRIE